MVEKHMESIEKFIDKADKLLDYGDYKKAQIIYEKALSEIPKPQEEHEFYIEIIVAIADTLKWQNKNKEALKLYERILKLPEADKIAYIHLRRGQVALDTDNIELAESELKKAFELGGEEIFEGEDDDYYNCALGMH